MIKFPTALLVTGVLVLTACQSADLNAGSTGLFGYPASSSSLLHARKIEARTQFRAENYAASFDIFKEISEAHPRDSDAWLGLAASADRLQRFDTADSAYSRLSSLKPGDPTVYNNLGYSHLLRGNVKTAYAYLAQARQLAPGSRRIANNLQLIRSRATPKATR
ncbi:hypothetical protein U0C82_13355 [Fulvimarina sp. 2208YS6-2-32]|uniref:Tetratricopeptide repeat protein n=1 Tax=Fulvimarina uroteuthidis TaxID=3098149 RepID=A0ABU5I436_9HYPH|nr:hypothetical protein [Fulvimarina sp. 2208YS6-2-32]MDY8110128.1 hypothetical protein [Fulvimarina sp. 2208YS6-2-32]